MSDNGKDANHTRHIDRRVNVFKICEKWKIHITDLCEGGLQLADIATENVGENDLNPRMKYIMARLENWYRTLVQEGW